MLDRVFMGNLYDRLVSTLLDNEADFLALRMSKVAETSFKHCPEPNIVGVFYKGDTYDMPGDHQSWHKRKPLHENYYKEMDDLLAEKETLRLHKRSIIVYMRQVFIKSKSFADLKALLPDLYMPHVRAVLTDAIQVDDLILDKDMISVFKKKHKLAFKAFNEYLVKRMILR